MPTAACRALAPPLPLGAFTVKCTCIVSSLQVTFAGPVKLGHAAPGASDTKLAVPEAARHSVTAPPVPTASNNPFTMPLPSPMVPLTDVGGVPLGDAANPLTSTRLVSFDGSSSPTSVHVEKAAFAPEIAR